MKAFYNIILYIVLIIVAFVIQILQLLDQVLINLIILNIIVLILRKPLILFADYIFQKQLYRVLASALINIGGAIFVFWLILALSFDFFIALLSFLVVAISFTFKSIINNIASGALMLTAEQFEIGDLIESNNIQGVAKEISLNYTKLTEFDGVEIIIPNSNVFGSTMIKFTHKRLKPVKKLKRTTTRKERFEYRKYLKEIQKILSLERKVTRYVKEVEILGSINPEELDDLLDDVFDKYEPIFGMRPSYCIDLTRYGRLRILLYVDSDDPKKVLNNIDAYLRDLVFKLYQEEIYQGWDEYKKSNNSSIPKYEGG